MSIATVIASPLSIVKHRTESGINVIGAAVSERVTVNEGVRTIVATGAPSPNSRNKLKGFSLKRRLKGFLSETAGENWKAIFVVNGETYPYELPSKELKHADIKERYQPFEMDEFVSTIPGIMGKLYRFRPLAKSSSATLEALPLDQEQIKKRDRILARFKKA